MQIEKDGRRNAGEDTKQKTSTVNFNKHRKKRRRSQAQKSGTTPKTNLINSQVANDTHLLHINLTPLSSPTGVPYTCNMKEAELL